MATGRYHRSGAAESGHTAPSREWDGVRLAFLEPVVSGRHHYTPPPPVDTVGTHSV